MAKIVEQVDEYGNIVDDYDTSLSVKAIFEVIYNSFPSIYKDDDGMICGEMSGKRFAIRAKNITYLGHPHPLYKKRIQIASDLQDFYRKAMEKNSTPILLGVYTYEKNTLFCDFNIEDFIEKKAHNSSAHVYTSDLSEATIDGFFYKEDYFGNKITVFTPNTVDAFLADKLVSKKDSSLDTFSFDSNQNEMVAEESIRYNIDHEVSKIGKNVMDFFKYIDKKWMGIECYKTMMAADYKNKYQPEWPGFYLEFTFEKFLNDNKLNDLIRYAQDKSKGGIDLDLYFPTIEMYGDLKAHSNKSNGIQGNDWQTVFKLIDNPARHGHIYYIVGEHETYKDSDFGYEVTVFWNTAQKKDNLMSYSKRMKNSIEMTHAYLFDINANNKHYLTKFRQGLNSNGRPREPKIMIEKDNFSHFILEEREL